MTASSRDIPLFEQPFFFLRHGETESNVHDAVAGSTDVPLTDFGHAQARAAAHALDRRGVTAIYSSALRRARDTADHVSRALGLPVTVIPALAERNWGILEGKPRALRVPGVTPPEAETLEEFADRVLRGLSKIDAGGTPVIVAHSGVFRVLCHTLGMPEPDDRVANALPVRCLPPDSRHPAWHFEVL